MAVLSGSNLLMMLHILLGATFIVRVLLRPHREPASRIAWVVVMVALPFLGIAAYILFGEVNIGQRRVERIRQVLAAMPRLAAAMPGDKANLEADIPERYEHLFRVGRSISGFEPVAGNSARRSGGSNAGSWLMIWARTPPEPHSRCGRDRLTG